MRNEYLWNSDWLYAKYIDERCSLKEIASLAGVPNENATTVRRALIRIGLPLRSVSEGKTGRTHEGVARSEQTRKLISLLKLEGSELQGTKWCNSCKSAKSYNQFYKSLNGRIGLSTYCKICYKAKGIAKRHEIRNQTIVKYGGKCSRCGYSDVRALQFDHVNGGGLVQRKVFNTYNTLIRILNTEPGDIYQLLCANCNWIKKHKNHEHGSTYAKRVELEFLVTAVFEKSS